MIISVHQPQYLPWLGYFDKIIKSDCFVFLDKVQYKHREYQNRNKIRTKYGWMWLSVPVAQEGLGRQIISDVRIDNSSSWQIHHWKSLKSWYSAAKYFHRYANFFEEIYLKKAWEKLLDINVRIIQFALQELGVSRTIYFESELNTTKTNTERIIEICKKLKADTYLSGSGGKAYLEEDRFMQEGIELKYQDFQHPTYAQNFSQDKSDFIPCMSIADLLFNAGLKSREILKAA